MSHLSCPIPTGRFTADEIAAGAYYVITTQAHADHIMGLYSMLGGWIAVDAPTTIYHVPIELLREQGAGDAEIAWARDCDHRTRYIAAVPPSSTGLRDDHHVPGIRITAAAVDALAELWTCTCYCDELADDPGYTPPDPTSRRSRKREQDRLRYLERVAARKAAS